MQESTVLEVSQETLSLLNQLGVPRGAYLGGRCTVYSPITGKPVGQVPGNTGMDTATAMGRAHDASHSWQAESGPRRGQLALLIGEELQKVNVELQRLMMLESGKTPEQSADAMQEMIVVCGFAARVASQPRPPAGADTVGEDPIPLAARCGCGVVSAGTLSAGILALARGAAVLWAPTERAPLTALAIHAAVRRAINRFGSAPEGLMELLLASRAVADLLNHTGICSFCGGEQLLQHSAKSRRAAAAISGTEPGGRECTALDRKMEWISSAGAPLSQR